MFQFPLFTILVSKLWGVCWELNHDITFMHFVCPILVCLSVCLTLSLSLSLPVSLLLCRSDQLTDHRMTLKSYSIWNLYLCVSTL